MRSIIAKSLVVSLMLLACATASARPHYPRHHVRPARVVVVKKHRKTPNRQVVVVNTAGKKRAMVVVVKS